MRALLSLGLDLLGHPAWLIGIVSGLVTGGWLMSIANDHATRERHQRDRMAAIDAEWYRCQQDAKARRVHRSARSIVSPDGPKAA